MKIRRLSQFQKQITFPNFDNVLDKHITVFQQTDLGKIYEGIPWDDLAKSFGLKEKAKGPDCIFSPRGKLALMFLKHYCCCSDNKLIEQFNGNIHYQIFCDTILRPGDLITNFKIVSQIRCELAEILDEQEHQKILMNHWRPFMSDLKSILCDATCYESHMRYPTDVKLLWEAVQWIYTQIQKICKSNKLRMPRTKFLKWVRRYVSFSKMRKKTRKKRKSLTRGLLRLLDKLNVEILKLEQTHTDLITTNNYKQRRATIQEILTQQSAKFYEGQRPQGAIVSIDKPYIRPIVRGKEVKPVEFGAKVHKLQIDGISFIEHLSFDAYNEGTRIQQTLFTAQSLTHTKVKILGADAIYATNANRKLLTAKGISTDFKIKGKPGRHKEHKEQISKLITIERASRLEGSFGTDKEYYHLKRIRARNEKTERLWIFFGIHTLNALNIGRRMSLISSKAA